MRRAAAIAYHNLGMLSADRELWDDADRYYTQSIAIAEAIGDVHLRGLCLLNHAEVHLAGSATTRPARTPRLR